MPRKRKLSNLADRCRFCLARDACMSELFAEWLRPKLENLQRFTGLQILDKANYPRKICYVCLYKLEMWDEFKAQFLKTNKTLITHFKIVEETIPEVNKSLDSTQDDLLSDDNNKKRPKIDSTKAITELAINNLKTPEKVKPLKNVFSVALAEIEENILSSVSKNQLSDNSTGNSRRGRSTRIEREASTKRWEERKNALIAATGEIPSESESDNGSQLSPVQKARVKARNIELEFDRQKKIQKALKNLQTNLTEKYKVSYEDMTNERKTRSQQESAANHERKIKSPQDVKPKPEEICVNDNVTVNLLKSPLAEKKLGMLNVKKEMGKVENKVEQVIEERNLRKSRKGKKVEKVQMEVEAVIDLSEEVNDQSNEIEAINNKSDKKPKQKAGNETVNNPKIESICIVEDEELPKKRETVKKIKKVDTNKNAENDIDVIDLDDIEDDIVSTNISQNQEIDIPFKPQELKSEVTLGNATYVVTTILDLPGSTPEIKNDISLKTNGLNIDTASQERNKVDIMNAVQLQKVPSKNIKEENKKSDVHQCLKIEIEGMEAQALQRVQLDLAHFVTDEIQHILMEGEPSTEKPSRPNKPKDSYETLNHQLKAIVKKVLRSNFETDKLVSTSVNLNKFSPEFLEAASYSPVFQPQVILRRLNFGQLCKTYKINNLHILEDAKRRRGVAGPLSRTLGKRRPVLPKKFEDFALSVQDEIKLREEESRLKNTLKASTTTAVANATISSKPMVTIPVAAVANSSIPSAGSTKTIAIVKGTMPSSNSTPVPYKITSTASKATPVTSKSAVNATSKSTTLSMTKTILSTTNISSAAVNKPNTTMSNVSVTATNRTSGSMSTIAKIRSEVPPVSTLKSTIPDSVDSLVMDWTDSDHSTNDSPIIHELPKPEPKVKEIPTPKKLEALNLPASGPTLITKSKSSMTATRITVPKASAQSTVQVMSTTSSPVKAVQVQQKVGRATSQPTVSSIAIPVSQKYRHLCGICNKEMFSEKEAEAHVKSHQKLKLSSQLKIYPEAAAPKATPSPPSTSKPALGTQAPSKPPLNASTPIKPAAAATGTTPGKTTETPKPKLMRCKRCQAIVEAEQVKLHVCNAIKYNCTICECRFGAKHLLDTHMESTHLRRDTSPTQIRQAKSSPVKEKQRVILIQESNESKKSQSGENLEAVLSDKNAPRSEGYSCFVCDKMFDDEIQMKEHLYMHSDEVNDDGDDKGFPCAFCFEKFQTEESLEAHVDKHLKDDGDEKINMLIDLNTNRRERKRAMFRCEICTDSFTSAMLLAMHMQEHEDEEAELQAQEEAEMAATAERQEDADPEPFVCTICDQMFESSEELSEHLDMHNGNAHVCILCEKPFSSIKDLQEHVNTHL